MRYVFIVLLLGVLVACSRNEDASVAPGGDDGVQRRPVIYTVNYPLAAAARHLAGDWARVVFPMVEEGDPAFWQPAPEQLADYQQADLILLNGAGYTRWLSHTSLPENRLVDTSRTFSDQLIAVDSGPVHSHGPEGDHSHGELAFTVWLDLELYAQQVQAIAVALARKYPHRANDVAAREKVLLDRVAAMDEELAHIGRAYDGAPVLYSHPVYQYFERAYGFNGQALHWEPDQLPRESEWSALQGLLSGHPARVMLWEDEPLPQTRERLQEMGVRVVVAVPMGNRPAEGDFLSGMAENIERLRMAAEQHVD